MSEATTAPPVDAPASDGTTPAPPVVTRLVLARHAVTAQTGPLLSGRQPGIALSEEGRRQAAALADRLAPLPVAAVYASPIERTTETAQAVAQRHQLEVRAIEGVLEADYGEWTGQKLADLAKTDLWKVVQRAPSRASFPGGESLAAMQARMVQALEGVVADHPGALVVVVSHADPIKAAIAHYTGVHLDLFQRIVVNPASVTAFAFSGAGVALLKCNDTGTLDDLRPPPPKQGEQEKDKEKEEAS
jgi:probable phosphomutase (TIGR03848 family)